MQLRFVMNPEGQQESGAPDNISDVPLQQALAFLQKYLSFPHQWQPGLSNQPYF